MSQVKDKFYEKLVEILKDDLDFHNFKSNYSSHNFHSFPAKFPPQLPQKFILNLTSEGDIVLDPMVGSGTTLLEGFINNRKTIGFDVDPLALMITKVKTTIYDKNQLINTYNQIMDEVSKLLLAPKSEIERLYGNFDFETQKFIEYWFYEETVCELLALSNSISKITEEKIRLFFQVIFSSIIITKTGGVSLALDLAHTRPHKAKKVYTSNSDLVFSQVRENMSERYDMLVKKLRSPVNEFKKKFLQNVECVIQSKSKFSPRIGLSDSQNLPLKNNSVDLIVTSPPYASNAIDYMRAHKFSLIWFGYSIIDLKEKRKKYIGGDSISDYEFETMPKKTTEVIQQIKNESNKKSLVLHRYYSEMLKVFKEMYRVLKPGKAAIVVVGNSVMSGISSETHLCLKEIGEDIGFSVPHIGVRNLDRNRRMMPATYKKNSSTIINRMNEEYVIGLYK